VRLFAAKRLDAGGEVIRESIFATGVTSLTENYFVVVFDKHAF